MKEDPLASLLKGIVEADETYVGGSPRDDGKEHKRGRGTKKTAVLAVVERGGKVVSKPVKDVSAKTLKTAIREVVDRKSAIMTDEWISYHGLENEFSGGHAVVNHGAGEYVRGLASTNTVESYFALLKRGIHGTFHHVSKKHLLRYCNEFSFRWDNRKVTDGERAEEAIKGMDGKRLLLSELLGDGSNNLHEERIEEEIR